VQAGSALLTLRLDEEMARFSIDKWLAQVGERTGVAVADLSVLSIVAGSVIVSVLTKESAARKIWRAYRNHKALCEAKVKKIDYLNGSAKLGLRRAWTTDDQAEPSPRPSHASDASQYYVHDFNDADESMVDEEEHGSALVLPPTSRVGADEAIIMTPRLDESLSTPKLTPEVNTLQTTLSKVSKSSEVLFSVQRAPYEEVSRLSHSCLAAAPLTLCLVHCLREGLCFCDLTGVGERCEYLCGECPRVGARDRQGRGRQRVFGLFEVLLYRHQPGRTHGCLRREGACGTPATKCAGALIIKVGKT
jgi:hypothetical protein